METVILVIHCLLAIALVGVVLLQRSEGGALGIGGGNMGGMMTSRGTENLLTRVTSFLAAAFIGTSLILAILAGPNFKQDSLISDLAEKAGAAVVPAATPSAESQPASSQAPLTQPSLIPNGEVKPDAAAAQTPVPSVPVSQ